MNHFKGLLLFVAVCLVFALPLSADIVPILSQGTTLDPSESNNGNTLAPVLGTGVNVVLTGYPGVWMTPPAGSSWISYADTGLGGPADNPSVPVAFLQPFLLPYSSNTGSITVWADDTARVLLDGVLKFAANTTPGSACAAGPIGCIPANGGVISLDGLPQGAHTLTFETFQLNGDGFGLLYAGSVESTPEPTGIVLLGTCLLGVVTVLRKRFS